MGSRISQEQSRIGGQSSRKPSHNIEKLHLFNAMEQRDSMGVLGKLLSNIEIYLHCHFHFKRNNIERLHAAAGRQTNVYSTSGEDAMDPAVFTSPGGVDP